MSLSLTAPSTATSLQPVEKLPLPQTHGFDTVALDYNINTSNSENLYLLTICMNMDHSIFPHVIIFLDGCLYCHVRMSHNLQSDN